MAQTGVLVPDALTITFERQTASAMVGPVDVVPMSVVVGDSGAATIADPMLGDATFTVAVVAGVVSALGVGAARNPVDDDSLDAVALVPPAVVFALASVGAGVSPDVTLAGPAAASVKAATRRQPANLEVWWRCRTLLKAGRRDNCSPMLGQRF